MERFEKMKPELRAQLDEVVVNFYSDRDKAFALFRKAIEPLKYFETIICKDYIQSKVKIIDETVKKD